MAATTEQAAAPATFSAAIRTATMTAHHDAQTSPFMKDLLAGTADVPAYAHLVAQHYFVYRQLERAADAMSADDVARRFASSDLWRTPSLESDLTHLLGENWPAEITPTPATSAYCRRIDEACSSWPGGFVAHHYVRYMGDLSGGQHIGEIVRRTYNFNGRGARFYTFDDIADGGAFKDEYRRNLDTAPWDDGERQRIIDEILLAYDLNTLLLQSLS